MLKYIKVDLSSFDSQSLLVVTTSNNMTVQMERTSSTWANETALSDDEEGVMISENHARGTDLQQQFQQQSSYEKIPLPPIEWEAHLAMLQCDIRFVKRQGKFGYFEMRHPRTGKVVKLTRQSMVTLCEYLPEAFKVAKTMPTQAIGGQSTRMIKELFSYKETKIHLFVNVYEGRAIIWVRSYNLDKDTMEYRPSKKGAIISIADDLQQLKTFVATHKDAPVVFDV